MRCFYSEVVETKAAQSAETLFFVPLFRTSLFVRAPDLVMPQKTGQAIRTRAEQFLRDSFMVQRASDTSPDGIVFYTKNVQKLGYTNSSSKMR
jgi:hypothetical protein